MKKTIPIKWTKPFDNMWLADTTRVHVAINKLRDGTYTAVFKHMEIDWDSNIRTHYQHLFEGKTLAEAKQWGQERFDEHFLPLAKRMRSVRSKRKGTKKGFMPMWPRQKFCY